MALDLSGRTAVVTGAGRGIGRLAALGLARRGAQVLVNDYGGGGDTMTPGSLKVAQDVVDEIRDLGGTAEADGSSVGTGASADVIINHAIDAFGRVDILINNAGGSLGIVRITEDTDEQVEGVIRTNLLGPYMLMRRVWPHMSSQGGGRIVNMMSGTVMGMIGTSAYVAGKAGLMGLTKTAALEGAPVGIKVNCVWPIGLTRLSGKLEDDNLKQWMQQFDPSLVAETMVFLASSENQVSGEMFTAGAGVVARNDMFSSLGYRDPELTAERLHQHFAEARDMDQARGIFGPDGETWHFR